MRGADLDVGFLLASHKDRIETACIAERNLFRASQRLEDVELDLDRKNKMRKCSSAAFLFTLMPLQSKATCARAAQRVEARRSRRRAQTLSEIAVVRSSGSNSKATSVSASRAPSATAARCR